jgi:hypothetical protein
MPLSSIYWRVKKSMVARGRGTRPIKQGRSRIFRPLLEQLEDRRLLSTVMQLNAASGTIDSYAGVGFQENYVATLFASVNGQADPNSGDFQAQIDWGDGLSSTGDLVYEGPAPVPSNEGPMAEFFIMGTHVYQQLGSSIPIVVTVTGPDDTSVAGQTGSADVADMPSGIPGTPPSPPAITSAPEDVGLQFWGSANISSYAGVGFQQNYVAILQTQVNGQEDPQLNDYSVQINWGDSASWTSGELVYEGPAPVPASDGPMSQFLIKGSHVYDQPGTYPVVVYVTGPDGTSVSGQTASADVADMPSGIPGSAPSTPTPTSAPENVGLQFWGSAANISSYAGVGFQQNSVAILQTQVNGQADPQLSDYSVQINWGDSASWTSGDLVYEGPAPVPASDGPMSEFLINGSHVYQQPGIYPIVVYVTGPDGTSISDQTGSATVAPNPNGLSLGSLSSTQWTDDKADYFATISVDGGTDGYKDVEVTGLPPGLTDTLKTKPGTTQTGTLTISGTPTQSGTFNLQVSLEDGDGNTLSEDYTLIIDPAPITLGSLSPAQWDVNEPGYDGTITVSGGSGTYSDLSVTSLPTGLTANLSGSTITVSGTPTESGTFTNIAVSLEDSNGDQGSGTESLLVTAATLTLTPTTLPGDTAGQSYNQTISATGGSGHYSFARTSGSLPTGLSRSSTGRLSGTPTTAGTYSFTIEATDTSIAGLTGSRDYTLTVKPASATTFAVHAPNTATAGTGFGITITAEDKYGNAVPSYGGTVTLTSSDGEIMSPATVTLTAGTAATTVTLQIPGSVRLRATAVGNIGTSNTILVGQTNGTFLLGATWVENALGAAQQIDQIAKYLRNYTSNAVDQFLAGVANWAGTTLQFLAQKPGVPAQQMFQAIARYFTNNAYENNLQMYKAAVQAINEMEQNPAYFWGNNLPNLLMAARGIGAAAQEVALANEVRQAEAVAQEIEGLAGTEGGVAFEKALQPLMKLNLDQWAEEEGGFPGNKFPVVDGISMDGHIVSMATGTLAQLKQKFSILLGASGSESTYTSMLKGLGRVEGSGPLSAEQVIPKLQLAVPDGDVGALRSWIQQNALNPLLVGEWPNPQVYQSIEAYLKMTGSTGDPQAVANFLANMVQGESNYFP